MATQVPFFQLAKATWELFGKAFNDPSSFTDRMEKFTGVKEPDRKFAIKFIQTIYLNSESRFMEVKNEKNWNDKIINQGFIPTDSFKNEVAKSANSNMKKNIKIYQTTSTETDEKDRFGRKKKVKGGEVEITDRLEINEYYNKLKEVRMEFKPADLKPENLDINILYKFFVFCFMQFYAKFTFKQYDGAGKPWEDIPDKQPKKDGESYWVFRCDSREPKVIFKEGFKVAVESFPKLKPVNDAIKELEKSLGGDNGNKIWYRYGQQDLCTETGISIAPHFRDVLVFPLYHNEWKLPDGEKAAYFFNNAPEQKSKKFSIWGGGSRLRCNIFYSPPGKKTYVYIMKIEGSKINDTAGLQGADVWPELGTRSISIDRIKACIEIIRWPNNAIEGWLVYKKTHISKDYNPPDTIKEMIRKIIKDRLHTYKWTNNGGEVKKV
ncbi:MAG: hypothetical protein JXA18_00900 [Chitinispirillaceae bacterium]|nr:hypothetical protein [Chitinispirillaceae bacterium]